jgi:hypothetical protein
MIPNPLSYDIHRHRQPDHAKAISLAMIHRQVDLSYRQSSRILVTEGLHISSKIYYNSRHLESQETNASQLNTLFQAFEASKFHYLPRYSYSINLQSGSLEAKELEQVFFCISDQIKLVQRFVSNMLLITNATFNTNYL